MQFAVADIKACSNGTTDGDGYGFSISDFQLVDTNSRTYTFCNVQVGARSPNPTDSLRRRLRSAQRHAVNSAPLPGNAFIEIRDLL
ncbi:hypothetical protein ACSNOB_02255 [Micromonospora sp. URMC 106]|uniref:hypothetical protein n=1 Tax=Micromonospora sp. URMC 106 TaxID=3423408 RepID=UPI003F1C2E61